MFVCFYMMNLKTFEISSFIKEHKITTAKNVTDMEAQVHQIPLLKCKGSVTEIEGFLIVTLHTE